MIEDNNIYCSNCGRNTNKTIVVNIYECEECQDYFNVTIKNDQRTLDSVSENVRCFLELNKELESIQKRNSDTILNVKKPNKFIHNLLIFFGIILMPTALFLPVDSSYHMSERMDSYVAALLVLGFSLILIISSYKSYKKKSKNFNYQKEKTIQIKSELINKAKEIEALIKSKRRDLLDDFLE